MSYSTTENLESSVRPFKGRHAYTNNINNNRPNNKKKYIDQASMMSNPNETSWLQITIQTLKMFIFSYNRHQANIHQLMSTKLYNC